MIFDRLIPRNQPTTRRQDIGNRISTVPLLSAGMNVSHDTALKFNAVFSAIRAVSEIIACLPWQVYRRQELNVRERSPNNYVETVLNRRPNPEMSAYSFKETLIAWAMSWGNGYAEIVRDNANRPIELWPISPDRVNPKRDPDTRELIYEINNNRGAKTYLGVNNVFHLKGLGFDGISGYSVISYAAKTIGKGLATDEYEAAFFQNGTALSGVLTHPNTLSQEAYDRLKKEVREKKSGPQNAGDNMILEEGMKWEEMGMSSRDAQLIQSKQVTVLDVCRWFRIPPHKLYELGRMTFNNIEESNLDWVTDTLWPWVTRLEHEADWKLFGINARLYTKLQLNALMRGKMLDRAEFYTKMRDLGVYSINEIREKEDMNPIGSDGDKRFVQMNMTTIEKAGEDKPAPAPPPPPDNPNQDPNAPPPEPDQNQNAVEIFQPILAKTIGALIRGDQLDSLRKRYKDNTALAACAAQHFAKREQQYRLKLDTPVKALFKLLGLDRSPDEFINTYIEQHINESREYLFTGTKHDDRENIAAQALITQAIDYRSVCYGH